MTKNGIDNHASVSAAQKRADKNVFQEETRLVKILNGACVWCDDLPLT